MNPLRLAREVRVEGTYDDAGMVRRDAMELDEILSIQGKDSPLFVGGECQYFRVGNSFATPSGFLNRQYIVPFDSEGLDDR